MKLNFEQKQILNGKEGKILQSAMVDLVKYAEGVGAEEFIPIKSAHTAFSSMDIVALAFPPRGRRLNDIDIKKFTEEFSKTKVKVKTTINPGIIDKVKWQKIGSNENVYKKVMEAVEISRRCGMLHTQSCIPHLTDNIPFYGEHYSWCESSAHPYINSFFGARTNRDCYEISLFSALLGITPNFGMHLDENRKGTDLVEIQCELKNASDWGALGFFLGERLGISIPVLINLKQPTVEEAIQLCASMNSSGAIPMFHIPGVTPEAPTIEHAFGGNKPKRKVIFDDLALKGVYQSLNYQPKGNINMVFLGCPHKTLYDIKEIARLVEGKKVANNTKLWIETSSSIRDTAEKLGYKEIIETTGGELLADGCLLIYYINTENELPQMNNMVTDSIKNAAGCRRSFKSKTFYASTEKCIEIAIKGEII